MHQQILILDFGSQYTQLIARRIRELKVYSSIIPCTTKLADYDLSSVLGVILSGSPSSVKDQDAPVFDPAWVDCGKPILGVCYGMQLLANLLGGKIASGKTREYGCANSTIKSASGIFANFEPNQQTQVWMSHGDHVVEAPKDFSVIASSRNLSVAAFASSDHLISAIQFHPEVVHSVSGKEVLANFVYKICKAKGDWTPGDLIAETIEKIKREVPDQANVICALSGGVDSTVAAVLVDRAIGKQLRCVFVDNGLLRLNEGPQVAERLKKLGLNLTHVDASKDFSTALKGVSNPEHKRKIIGAKFIDVFEQQANSIPHVTHLVQGTLYPDVIESISVNGPSAVIKSHHNVGGLPERMKLKLLEPLRELFKDEVRAIGRALEIPAEFIDRQPFPGPGLAVRMIGEIDRDSLDSLRLADDILQAEVKAAGLYNKLWQSFCVLLPVKSVGVMGDSRTYERAVAIRAVQSDDGMTADWAFLPENLLRTVSNRIINEVKGVNRVVLDISSKPPATIEWE